MPVPGRFLPFAAAHQFDRSWGGEVKRTSPGYRRSEEIDPEWIPRRFGFGAKIKKPTSVGTYVDLSLFRSPLPRDSEGHEPP